MAWPLLTTRQGDSVVTVALILSGASTVLLAASEQRNIIGDVEGTPRYNAAGL